MTCWRIKHQHSGLFFIASRLVTVTVTLSTTGQPLRVQAKSNLSTTGKIYSRKPSLSFVGDGIYNPHGVDVIHPNDVEKLRRGWYQRTAVIDWRIEEC